MSLTGQIQPVRGMNDVLPAESVLWQHLEGVVREPDLYKCAIGYAGVYDLRVQLDKSDTQESNFGVDYLHRALGDDRDDLLRRSPLGGVDKIKANILLIHGESDPRVPFKNFQEFTRALDAQHKPYQSLTKTPRRHSSIASVCRQPPSSSRATK